MTRVSERTGDRYGRLVVVMRGPNTTRGDARWLARCDCGRWTVARGYDLANGNTASCGCVIAAHRHRRRTPEERERMQRGRGVHREPAPVFYTAPPLTLPQSENE